MTRNPYEIARRQRKAISLALYLQRQGCTAEMAERATPENWLVFAAKANVIKPSPMAQFHAIEYLRMLEASRNSFSAEPSGCVPPEHFASAMPVKSAESNQHSEVSCAR